MYITVNRGWSEGDNRCRSLNNDTGRTKGDNRCMLMNNDKASKI